MNVELLFIINLSVLINHSNEKHARKRNHAFTAVSLTRRIYPKGWTIENGSLSLFCLAVAIEDAFKKEKRKKERVVLSIHHRQRKKKNDGRLSIDHLVTQWIITALDVFALSISLLC